MTSRFPRGPVPLFGGGDERCQTLCDVLLETIEERGRGLPLPSVLGVLRIVEHHLIAAHIDEEPR